MFDNVEINIPGGLDFAMPRMAKIKQNFEHHKIEDVAAAVKMQVAKPEIKAKIISGKTIAVGDRASQVQLINDKNFKI